MECEGEPGLERRRGKEDGSSEGPSKLKELVYMNREMKNALNGIRFTHQLLESTAISDDQKLVLGTK